MTSRRRRLLAAAVGCVAIASTVACASGTTPDDVGPAPSGGELEVDARARYAEYRSSAAAVLASIDEGSWEVDQGRYGAVPLECSDDGYGFELVRRVWFDASYDRAEVAAGVESALAEAGIDATTATVGPVDQVRATDDVLGALLVELYPTGAVMVSVDSPCFPGDVEAVREIMFPDAAFGDSLPSYAPLTESPSDEPIFRFTGAPPATPPQTPADVVTDG